MYSTRTRLWSLFRKTTQFPSGEDSFTAMGSFIPRGRLAVPGDVFGGRLWGGQSLQRCRTSWDAQDGPHREVSRPKCCWGQG